MKMDAICQRFEEILELRFQDRIEPLPEEQGFMDEHQRVCPRCRARLEVDADLELLRDFPVPALGRVELAEVSEEILGEVVRRDRGPQWLSLAPLTVVASAALLVILLATTWFWLSARRVATPGDALQVMTASGEGELSDRPARTGDAWSPGRDLLVRKGQVKLGLAGNLTTLVEGRSRMALLEASDRALRFRLTRGSATFHFSPRKKGQRCTVVVPDGEVLVIGTVFRVISRERGTRVEVAEGQVRFAPRTGESVEVAAGLAYSADVGLSELSTQAAQHLLVQVDVAGPETEPKPAVEEPPAAENQPTPPSAPDAPEVAREKAPGRARRKGQGAEQRPVEPAAAHKAEAKAKAADQVPEGRPPVVASPRPPAGPAKLTLTELLGLAREQRRAGNWNGVLETYRAIIRTYPGTPDAYTCWFLMGQVQLQEQGRLADALGSFETYLRLHPAGSLVEEAEWGVVSALRALERSVPEKAALERFLRRFPGSPHREKAAERLKTLGGE